MEAPVPQASRELAGRHCHSMGGGAYYCSNPDLCRAVAGKRRHGASGDRLHRGRSHRPGAELRRADGRAGRSRGATGRDAPAAAADRTLQAQQRQEAQEVATGAIGGGQVTMDEAMLLAGPSPETGRAYTQQEFELRERLRLEALERRSRSLRSSPVAQTYRQLDRARSPAEAGAEPGPVEAIRAEGAAALSQALGTFQGVTGSLEDEIAAEADADQGFPCGPHRRTAGRWIGPGPGRSRWTGSARSARA